MIVKKHSTQDGQLILAICDDELLGKSFEEDEILLDLTGDFYRGEKMSEEDTKKLLDAAYVINVVGKTSVEFLKKHTGIKNVMSVQEIPYAQLVTE